MHFRMLITFTQFSLRFRRFQLYRFFILLFETINSFSNFNIYLRYFLWYFFCNIFKFLSNSQSLFIKTHYFLTFRLFDRVGWPCFLIIYTISYWNPFLWLTFTNRPSFITSLLFTSDFLFSFLIIHRSILFQFKWLIRFIFLTFLMNSLS